MSTSVPPTAKERFAPLLRLLAQGCSWLVAPLAGMLLGLWLRDTRKQLAQLAEAIAAGTLIPPLPETEPRKNPAAPKTAAEPAKAPTSRAPKRASAETAPRRERARPRPKPRPPPQRHQKTPPPGPPARLRSAPTCRKPPRLSDHLRERIIPKTI